MEHIYNGYSPAPWRAEHGQLRDAEGNALASYPNTLGGLQDIHNARLLAAAPELLEALQRLVWKSVDHLHGLQDYPETETPEYVQQLADYIKAARAAIAKATKGA